MTEIDTEINHLEPTASSEIIDLMRNQEDEYDESQEDDSEDSQERDDDGSGPLSDRRKEGEPDESRSQEDEGAAESDDAPPVTVESLQRQLQETNARLQEMMGTLDVRTKAYDQLMGRHDRLRAQLNEQAALHKGVMDREVERLNELRKDNDAFISAWNDPVQSKEMHKTMTMEVVTPMLQQQEQRFMQFLEHLDNQDRAKEIEAARQEVWDFADKAKLTEAEYRELFFDEKGETRFPGNRYRSTLEWKTACINAIKAKHADRLIADAKSKGAKSERESIEMKKRNRPPKGTRSGGEAGKMSRKDAFVSFMNHPEGLDEA